MVLACEVALEAAHGLDAALAFGSLAPQVSTRLWVIAMTRSARLSCRLPPRSRRWRSWRPEDTGIGTTEGVPVRSPGAMRVLGCLCL